MNYREKFIETLNKISKEELYKVNIYQAYVEVLESQDLEIERLNNLLKETSQILSEKTIKSITLKSENERLNNIINRIKSIYSSLCFSAPENNYIFIEKLGEVLQELKNTT